MTPKHAFTVRSVLAIGMAALATTPVYAADAGENELHPPDIRIEQAYLGRSGASSTVFLHGELVVPSNTTRAKACHGRVRMTARANIEVIASKSIALSSRCWFSGTMNVGSARRVRLTISFAGNDEMLGTSTTRTVKVQRPAYDPNIG